MSQHVPPVRPARSREIVSISPTEPASVFSVMIAVWCWVFQVSGGWWPYRPATPGRPVPTENSAETSAEVPIDNRADDDQRK